MQNGAIVVKRFVEQQSNLEELTLKIAIVDENGILPQDVSLPLKKVDLFYHKDIPIEISDFLKNCKNTLNDFSIHGNLSDSTIRTVMNELRELKHLSISSNYQYSDSISNQCAFLKQLHLSANPSIESLDLGLWLKFRDDLTLEIFKKLPNLKKLTMRRSTTEAMIIDFMHFMPNLEEICFWSHLPKLNNLLFPCVKSLKFSNSRYGYTIPMSQIANAFPNVDSIEIQHDCPTEYYLMLIAPMASLKYLTLGYGKSKLSTSAVVNFLDACSSLVHLKIPQSALLKKVLKKDVMKFEAAKKCSRVILLWQH